MVTLSFNPAKAVYVERAHYYFIANDVKSDEKKCAILFSGCGPETYQTIHSIVDTEILNNAKFETLVEMIIVQHFKFYHRTRAAGASIAAFVASL